MKKVENILFPCLQLDTIKAYLSGELSDIETHTLERHLLECPLCNDAVEGYSKFEDLSESQAAPIRSAEKLISDLDKTASEKFFKQEAKVISLNRYFRAIAATFLLMVVSASVVFYWYQRENAGLYEQYFSSYQNVHYFTFRGEASTWTDAELQKMEGFNHYDAENFAASAGIFESITKVDAENTMVRFYLGMSYMELEIFEQALEQFELVRINDPELYIESTYYAALCYIRLEEPKLAIQKLEEISDTSHPMYDKANLLLQTLR